MEQIGAMTSFQARLNLLVFILIAGLIAANALYFQEPAHSSKNQTANIEKIPPAGNKRSSIRIIPSKPEDTTQSINKEEPVEKKEEEDEDSPAATAELVKAIQRELMEKKYSPGHVDGAPGLETRAAILAFEYDRGLPLTASPSEEVLRKIIFDHPDKKKKSGPRKSSTPASRNVVRIVQKMLHSLGYAAGKIDGSISKDTQLAIKEFEVNRRMKATGRVSGKLIQELVKVTDIPTGR